MSTAIRRVAVVNETTIQLPPGDALSVPLPGSELAALNLASLLAPLVDEITYYGPHAPGTFLDGVRFADVRMLGELDDGDDLAVVWLREYRIPPTVLARFAAALNVLWTEDSVRDMSADFRGESAQLAGYLDEYSRSFDTLVFASAWHRQNWETGFGFQHDSPVAIYNSVGHVGWRPEVTELDPRRLLHTSHPRKALATVARVAETLVPDGFSMTCTSSPSLYQDASCRVITPRGNGRYESLGTFAEFADRNAGVLEFIAPYPARTAAQALNGYGVLIHPDCSEETGASVVLEALHRGLIPVVSSLGALPEIVGDAGIVVPGEPWSERFVREYGSAVRSLGDEEYRSRLIAARNEQWLRWSSATILNRWMAVLGIVRPVRTKEAELC